MEQSRRDFLKKLGGVSLGIGWCLPLFGALGQSLRKSSKSASPVPKQLGLVIDVRKCLREDIRRACIEACNREHNIPRISDPEEEVKWLWTLKYEKTFPDQAHDYTGTPLKGKRVLVLCNHCTTPACVKVCPTQATWKRETDGVVMMDMHRCIGCRYCMAACPYGARSFNWSDPRQHLERERRPEYPTRSKGVVEKCTFCAERLRDKREPACVEAARKVPGGEGALVFGDLTDSSSEVARVLREKHTICRRVGLGTGPNVYYII